MKQEGKIKRFLRFLFGNALVKGALKSVPIVNVIYDIADEVKKNKEERKASDWLAIVITFLCIAGIIYSLLTKQITIDEFIELLKKFQ